MKWSKVGKWLKSNAGSGTALIGSLITGNVPGAIAAGVSLVSGATGTNDPTEVLAQLQGNPETMLKLKELYYQNEESIRQHLEAMTRLEMEDQQHEHSQTQETIRAGDNSLDERIRLVRPTMAKQSWVATIGYCIGCFGVRAITSDDLFSIGIATILSSPAWAYLGLRSGDKLSQAWKNKGSK
jgi:hypothetical protein